jgi:hypothetical protein
LYAAKLFERSIVSKEVEISSKLDYLVGAFRCFLSSGSDDSSNQAALLVESNLEHCKKVFAQLLALWKATDAEPNSPLGRRRATGLERVDNDNRLNTSITNLARIVCRSCNANKDETGLVAAIALLPSETEIIKCVGNLICSRPNCIMKVTVEDQLLELDLLWIIIVSFPAFSFLDLRWTCCRPH